MNAKTDYCKANMDNVIFLIESSSVYINRNEFLNIFVPKIIEIIQQIWHTNMKIGIYLFCGGVQQIVTLKLTNYDSIESWDKLFELYNCQIPNSGSKIHKNYYY